MILLRLLFICITALCAYFDIKTRRIPIILILVLIVIPVLVFMRTMRVSSFSFIICVLINLVRLFLKDSFGSGDVVLICATSFVFNPVILVNTVLLACLFAFIAGLVNNKICKKVKDMPFVPFILSGLLFSIILG